MTQVPMQPPAQESVTYGEARLRFVQYELRQTLVPVEHAISLPLPTLRCNRPGYAAYAGPARRRPGEPLRLSPPDRWWVISADGRQALLFAMTFALPMAENLPAERVEVPRSGRTIAQAEDDQEVLDSLLDRAAKAFFAGETAEPDLAADLREKVEAGQPAPVIAWYRGVAPDFTAWLGL